MGPAAPAQEGAPIGLDPSVAGEGTALLIAADESLLSWNGRPADSLTLALPRGTRVDAAARERLCGRRAAARSACPATSRIGFGRFVVAVRGYLSGSGEATLAWEIDAYLGRPLRGGDVASVVLTGRLLAADSVAALLEPALGISVPRTVAAAGRLLRRRSGAYGIEIHFAKLPVYLNPAAPIEAAPNRLELALSAVRRIRQDFVRRIRVRTLSGYEIRRIHDHRLIGHQLLRAPRRCKRSWSSEIRVGFRSGVQRTQVRIECTRATTRPPGA